MIAWFFGLLESMGITHPLHPVITHIPMGLVIGGFTFAVVAVLFKSPQFFKTSYHCSVLALIVIPFTICSGILDWQNTYAGEWLPAIKIKFVLAGVITVLMIAVVYVGKHGEKASVKLLTLYSMALLSAIGLGYWGGDLIFG